MVALFHRIKRERIEKRKKNKKRKNDTKSKRIKRALHFNEVEMASIAAQMRLGNTATTN